MRDYRPGLPPAVVDSELRGCVRVTREMERRAVLWFGEVVGRRLYRTFGFSSIQLYAADRLDFSEAKTAQFLRLCRELESLPELRRSVATGEVAWTKARTVASVATPSTERRWVERARTESRRCLERAVQQTRGRARAARRRAPGQGSLLEPAGGGAAADGGAALPGTAGGGGPSEGAAAAPDDAAALGATPTPGAAAGKSEVDSTAPPYEAGPIPASVTLRFPPELHARFEALVERLRKQHRRGTREELVVAGLESLAQTVTAVGSTAGDERTAIDPAPDTRVSSSAAMEYMGSPAAAGRPGESAAGTGGPAGNTRVSSSAAMECMGSPAAAETGKSRGAEPRKVAARGPVYQVTVRYCPGCSRGAVIAGRQDRPLDPAKMEAILCDARVRRPGGRNTATVPPRLRLEVLQRDGFRCRVPGCRSPRFLEVHHLVPRSAGGGNDPGNLVSLCSRCHQTLHDIGRPRAATLLSAGLPVAEPKPAP